jgi:hypothetical protein
MQKFDRVDPRVPECVLVPRVRNRTQLDDPVGDRTRQLEDGRNQFRHDEPWIASAKSEWLAAYFAFR